VKTNFVSSSSSFFSDGAGSPEVTVALAFFFAASSAFSLASFF
jgi:hypothetical protein